MGQENTTIAFLIVAHSNPVLLNQFINQLLTYKRSFVYIHVDAKSVDMISKIVRSDRVMIVPKHFDVRWGDYTQILVNNYLLQFAMSVRHHDYYSLHSGVDLAIRPVKEFADYLKDSNLYGYYECARLPCGWQYGGGLGRLALHWPKLFRRRISKYSPMRYLRSAYGKLYGVGILKGKELPPEYTFYGGADWFTIREDCAKDVLNYLEYDPKYQELFTQSLSGAEIFYVTLFETLKKDRIAENRNMLRYIDWKQRGQKLGVGSPNTCTMDFLTEIEASGRFFARKFDQSIDANIIAYFLKKTNGDLKF